MSLYHKKLCLQLTAGQAPHFCAGYVRYKSQPTPLKNLKKKTFEPLLCSVVLTGETVIIAVHNTYLSVYFILLSFLEYCTAIYLQSLINTEEYDRAIDQFNGNFLN